MKLAEYDSCCEHCINLKNQIQGTGYDVLALTNGSAPEVRREVTDHMNVTERFYKADDSCLTLSGCFDPHEEK
jgi:hypothetical protein